MTRKSEGATAGLRRGRTLATAGLGAATLIGGLVYAMPANAATNPTASVTMPASILNDGTPATATITVTGGDTAFTDLGSKITFTIPGDSTCAGLTVTPSSTTPGPAGTVSGCVFTVTTTPNLAANQAATPESYDIAVLNSAASGTLSLAYELDQLNATGGYLRTLATATGTAPIAGPTAANFKTVTPAFVKQNYTQSLFTPPVGGTASTTVYVSSSHTTSAGVTTTCYSLDTATTTVNGVTYDSLNDGLELDPTTGKIVSNPVATSTAGVNKASAVYGPNGGTDSSPASYIVVTNNGTAGATTASAGTTCSDPAAGTYATIPVAAHDVSSGAFSIPVAFTDVPLTGTFAKQIYTLGDEGVITGYADGSFQPATAISRQAMAALLDANYGGYGSDSSCTDYGYDSPFSDVPATSQFCMAIRDLADLGLFNGYPGGTFHPTANISRQAISAVLFRAYSYDRLHSTGGGDAACTSPIPFKDVSATSPFCGDIEWMKSSGLSNGYAGGTEFHPAANSTRQAVAAFLYGLQQLETP